MVGGHLTQVVEAPRKGHILTLRRRPKRNGGAWQGPPSRSAGGLTRASRSRGPY
jgi:hypothetical protein